MLNRHEAEGPRGWQQDQTHRGQSSLKRPGWGGGWGRGELGGPKCLFSVAVCTWVFDRKNWCLLRVNAYNNDSICQVELHAWGRERARPSQRDGGRFHE